MTQSVLIRPARESDVDGIAAFNAAMAMETEQRRLDLSSLRQGVLGLLKNPERGFYIVAESPSTTRTTLVGQIMITFEWSDWRNGVFWWIQSVYIQPEWRRQGVFRALHNHIQKNAQADPRVCGIRLYVKQENHLAQTVYHQVGLTPSGYTVLEQDFVFPGCERAGTYEKRRES